MGWGDLVIEWGALVMGWGALVMGWGDLVQCWTNIQIPTLVIESSSKSHQGHHPGVVTGLKVTLHVLNWLAPRPLW